MPQMPFNPENHPRPWRLDAINNKVWDYEENVVFDFSIYDWLNEKSNALLRFFIASVNTADVLRLSIATTDPGKMGSATNTWAANIGNAPFVVVTFPPRANRINFALSSKKLEKNKRLADLVPGLVEALGLLVGHMPAWYEAPYEETADWIREVLTKAQEAMRDAE